MDNPPEFDGVERDAPHERFLTGGGQGAWPEPAQAPRGLDALRLLAINHESASLTGFERAALAREDVGALRGRLETLGLDAVLISTCHRIELYWLSPGADADARAERVFREATGSELEPGVLLRSSGERVARHLFRVACGLDSLVLGESEVMGQVRSALESSRAADVLTGVFRAALRCAGCARAETSIGSGAQSVASAAAVLLSRSIATIERPRVVIVGAGETGQGAARHLRSAGVERLVLVNRTHARAESAARTLGVEAAPLESLAEQLRDADGVVVAVHGGAFLVTLSMAREAMAHRPRRPLVFSDLSMPRSVDPSVRRLPGVTLHDMLALEAVVRESRSRREREVPQVEALIERELGQLRSWANQQLLRPLMAEFRERAEAIRLAELRHVAREDMSDADVIDRLTRRLVERVITLPIATLRASRTRNDSCGLGCMRQRSEEAGHGSG